MLSRRIAGRYAEALFDLAQQQGTVQQWDTDLGAVAEVIAAVPDLTAVLTHPEVSLARKEEILRASFEGKVAKEVLAVLSLLVKRGHEPDMTTVREMYRELWNRARHILPVTVTSAVPLSSEQREALVRTLTQKTGANVQLAQQIDASIIAGLVITVGDRVIDASARTTLQQLRASMAGG